MSTFSPIPIVIPHLDPMAEIAALRAENATLRAEIAQLRAMVEELQKTVAEQRRTIAEKDATIQRLLKMKFGPHSERVEGPTLFDSVMSPEPAVVADPVPLDEPLVTTTKRKGHGRRVKPKELPRRREVIEPTDAEKVCPCCSGMKVKIGEVSSERYDYQPASIFVRELVRPTYACRACEQKGLDPQIAKAALPPEPLPKSNVGPGLLAHVIVSKFVDHLPLYRQESILGRHGLPIRRSTLCDYLQGCGQLLKPLFDHMHQRLLTSYAIHADDSPIKLLRPKRTAYAWIYLGDDDNPYTLFDFTAGRREEFPQRFLKDFKGFLHADGYSGYNVVHEHLRHVGCWMHARRYFVEAKGNDPRSFEALAFIRTLYAVEKEIEDERNRRKEPFTHDDGVKKRQSRAGPILERFKAWLEMQRATSTPSSSFGEALTYARNQWPSLIRYVDDARLAIDNGEAERGIRPLAIGRKNWLHIGGDSGLTTASVLLSVCASAKRNHLKPWAYLTDVLNQLASRSPTADMNDLLPDCWANRHSSKN